MTKQSKSTLERVSGIYGHLLMLKEKNIAYVSAKDLAIALGTTADTIKKDLSSLKLSGFTRKGYEVALLIEELGTRLNLSSLRTAAIVGLGRLGTALLEYNRFKENGFDIVAAFDSSQNKLETIKTKIPLFSVSNLERIIKDKKIEIIMLAVPAGEAQKVADKAMNAGIKGILNFSTEKISVNANVVYKDMDFISALRYISTQI